MKSRIMDVHIESAKSSRRNDDFVAKCGDLTVIISLPHSAIGSDDRFVLRRVDHDDSSPLIFDLSHCTQTNASAEKNSGLKIKCSDTNLFKSKFYTIEG